AYVVEKDGTRRLSKTGTPQVSEDYPKFNAFVYSAETFVPLLKLGIGERWTPNAHRGAPLNVGMLNNARRDNNPSRRDALLEEMRALYERWSHSTAVREELAKGVFNTLIWAHQANGLSRREVLFEERRQMYQRWPEDATVGTGLTGGLLYTLEWAQNANELTLRDAVLEDPQPG